VTGSSSGIGLATAKLAVEEGAKVLGIDVSAAPEALGNLPTTDFQFLQIDLTKADAPSTVVSNAVETFGGRIDALLNVAGVMDNNASADSVSDDMWDRCIAINLTAPVKLMREVLVVMKEQKSGSIVNVGSKASVTGAAAGVAYTASTSQWLLQ
jgi:NAD(P)-dependent dehydrogenase (short-subunit alcohol dehydrogenase family)